ncbi:MAG TPA: ATP-dependent helicase [Solirubrobacteraceae bacterium]|jgi:DNA helicase-2/ATP-dependent DNA helicase PcrA|nr:ATP-dependent helicase [Solirubrobacteraceae bacterium]
MTPIRWTTDAAAIPRDYPRADYRSLHATYIRPARAIDARRQTLEPPARPLLDWLAAQPGVAVTGVAVSPRNLADVYGYVAEPAYRLGVALIIVADRALEDIVELEVAEPRVGYAWSLQRLRYLCAQDGPPRRRPAATTAGRLDDSQLAAVSAHDGVVQIIAPAGSGKTTVLIARAAELVRRGVAAERILCTTFNKDAQRELQARLLAAGLGSVRAQTFHSLGYGILRDCRGLRSGEVRTLSFGQWRRLSAVASRASPDNEWIEPPVAAGMVSAIKLGRLMTPKEYRRHAPADGAGHTIATIYDLYERELAGQNANDFDDLIFLALRRLQRDAQLREQWQRRYDHVLVDEYQDIDPAQETLVQILAAPQDGLFAVGDEDQTLYAWRSASVERIVGLDGLYPGLQRVGLDHNYRCPAAVVECSRQIIENNHSRFPKRILPADARMLPDDPRPVIHQAYPQLDAGAADVARKLSVSQRGQIVVLARTSRMLRICAEACVPLDVKISAPETVFEPAGARAALEAYCRLLGDVRNARPEDVATVFRHPGRGLPLAADRPVADLLADGLTFEQAVGRLHDVAEHARRRVADGARILDTAATLSADAPRCIRFLRREGGLDEHFTEYEELTGGVEKVEIELLQDAIGQSAGMSVAAYAQHLTSQSDALRAIRDDDDGVELTTVHRAKGRQWPTVIVFGCDEGQMPHKRSLEDLAAGNRDALEAERRVAYVAFTRAQQRLVVLTTAGNASRFCVEAGLVAAPELAPAPAPKPQVRATSSRVRERPSKGPITGFEIARSAIRDPSADPRHILGACRSTVTAQRVLAAAVRSADAPSVERLTAGQAAALLQDLASSRDEELSIAMPDPNAAIADLAGPARRAAAEALKPRASS